jgi:type II secretory pathway pseudopilin PulG
MNFFKKDEIIIISLILLFLASVSFFNFKTALRRARDAQRRADVSSVANALEKFHKDYGKFPLSSEDGKIKACKPENFDDLVNKLNEDQSFSFSDYLSNLKACEWGKDSLASLIDEKKEPYLQSLPRDPHYEDAITYYYLSNGNRYQIYTYLEGEEDALGYDEATVGRNLACGNEICSFGKSFGKTPLDKSIQEYENELLRSNQ